MTRKVGWYRAWTQGWRPPQEQLKATQKDALEDAETAGARGLRWGIWLGILFWAIAVGIVVVIFR